MEFLNSQPVSTGSLSCSEDYGIKCQNFEVVVDEIVVAGNIMIMNGSCFIWLGSGEPRFANLAMALPTKYDPIPLMTTIISDEDAAGQHNGLMQRLAAKFHIQVFQSVNVELVNEMIWVLIERKLVEILSSFFP